MSPSLQCYKIHLIHFSVEIPAAPPPPANHIQKSQLYLESCFHLELREPRRSYPKKPQGLQPGTLHHQKCTRRAGPGPRFTLLTVREGMSESKSRCPVIYRYQNPQAHVIPCLLLELLCRVGCPEARALQGHCWLQRWRLLPQQPPVTRGDQDGGRRVLGARGQTALEGNKKTPGLLSSTVVPTITPAWGLTFPSTE